MPSQKRYTNQTFTKRIDHEGGAHRELTNPVEPSVCEKCEAVYENKRWTAKMFVRQHGASENWKPKATIVCPACKQIAAGIVGGYVSLDGAFLRTHREEIVNLLENEAARAAEDNPLSKIVRWNDGENGAVTIETTTEQLAQRFGRALEKACKGAVKYAFSHENKVARVSWHRD